MDTVAQQNLALEECEPFLLEARVMERSQQIAKISNLVEQTDDGFLVTDAAGHSSPTSTRRGSASPATCGRTRRSVRNRACSSPASTTTSSMPIYGRC